MRSSQRGEDSDAHVELDRVVERLRTMPLAQLAAAWPPFASRAHGARALAQEFADRAAEIAGAQRHTVPDAGDAAVGDQVAVTGRDLIGLDLSEAERAGISRRLRDFRLAL
jgi:hypothetical protein